ncbi:MAG TPA: universal stress protein [Mycobacteriales bacterium]
MSSERWGVLVGVDGSEASLDAAQWAAADAEASGQALTVCYVSDTITLTDMPVPKQLRQDGLDAGERTVEYALARVRHAAPTIDAAGHVTEGNPAAELIRMSPEAEQIVVGSRGVGGFVQLVLGSVGAEVATYARCPVVVVRGGSCGRREVVVGVDGSHHSDQALEYAFSYAARHGLHVHAVHALGERASVPLPPVSALAWQTQDQSEHARILLAEAVAPWQHKYPRVQAERTVVDGPAAAILTEASKGAALMVVGSRGHGGFAGLLLGSVSHALLRHAHCPVVVARTGAGS